MNIGAGGDALYGMQRVIMTVGISGAKCDFVACEGHRSRAQVAIVGIDDGLAIVIAQAVTIVAHDGGRFDPGRNGKAAGEGVRPTRKGLTTGGNAAAAKKLEGSGTRNGIGAEYFSWSPATAATRSE